METRNSEILIFDRNDQGYQQWAEANPEAYVLSTLRSKNPKHFTIHRTTCRSVRKYNKMAKPGGFTERQYIKVCSQNLNALRDWAITHVGPQPTGFAKRCSFCM